jgi:hypothetical protein
MIIQPHLGDLLLITQPDHAALARRIMAHWVSRGFEDHERRDSLLHAIEEHDNGWREIDTAPLVDANGVLLDFIHAPVEIRQGIWPRGVRRLAADPVAAALVAEHALYVYRRYAGDPAWRDFFTEMEILRDEFTAGAGLAPEDIARDYFFLRAADLLSLVFCNGWTEPQDIDDYVVRLDGDTLVVTPDPFAGASIAFEVMARRLPNRPYSSMEDAAASFLAGPVVPLAGRVRGG